jgi:DNA (cytosine-5)-methyltransferase 1
MRLLDLFCGAGGCSVGYARAGFEVVGVDIEPQPNYPFEFHQADALEALRDYIDEGNGSFDAIHASPPCHAFSTVGKQVQAMGRREEPYPDLVGPTRALLQESELPYVIENVPGAPLYGPLQLCGSSFGLDVRRHRLFECQGFSAMSLPCAHYWQTPRFKTVDKRRQLSSVVPVHGGSQINGLASVMGVYGHLDYPGERQLRERAMDIDWMSPYELTQAIPPAYTEHIGYYLMRALETANPRPEGRGFAD